MIIYICLVVWQLFLVLRQARNPTVVVMLYRYLIQTFSFSLCLLFRNIWGGYDAGFYWASNRQTEALTSLITCCFWVIMKYPQDRGREFSHGPCLSQNLLLATALQCKQIIYCILCTIYFSFCLSTMNEGSSLPSRSRNLMEKEHNRLFDVHTYDKIVNY